MDIKTWYVSEDFRSYGKNEDDNIGVDILNIYNLYCAIICSREILFNLLGILGTECTDELGYAWLIDTYNETGEIVFSGDKKACNEADIKDWYICDSYTQKDNNIIVNNLKAVFIGTRTNFLNIILNLEQNNHRTWTFVTKSAYPTKKIIINDIII